MKKTQQELITLLKKEIKKSINDKALIRERINYLSDNYSMPINVASDLLTMRIDIVDESIITLFMLLSAIKSNYINLYFTDAEIKIYSKQIKKQHFQFPIKWDMIQIEEDQWIGKITAQELMKLRDARLINYNENTQRTLKHVVDKDFEYYQIALNRNAVNAIIDSYTNDAYIPNTITLNIPEATDFKYQDGKLIIKEIEAFDILDGYHRYIAMSNKYNIDKTFDYSMELRVVCFPEEKARQFIWQEDQKTKMTKVDSESFNQSNPSNQVINLINQNTLLRNVINRNEGAINVGIASAMIDRLFFNTTKVINRKMIVGAKDILIKRMTALIDSDPGIYDKKWDRRFTMCAFTLIVNEKIEDDKLLEEINKLYEYSSSPSYEMVFGKNGAVINTNIVTRVEKLYAEMKEV